MARATITVRVRRTVITRVTVETVFKFSSRLSHSCDGKPGIRRERTADGFQYRRPSGTLVHDSATLARIKAMAIPPAWEDVWICPLATGHIQATGRDARGRKQYRYHPVFRASQDGEKFGRVAEFGSALVRIRKHVEADLARDGLPKEKVLAAVVKLLDRTHMRVGNAEYVKENHSFGLSTLLDRHVSFTSDSLRVRFRGKSGIWQDRKVNDRTLARVVRSCRDLPGQALFQYRDETGKLHRIGSAEINDYIREAAGGGFTAKDFRTWAGTVAALAKLAKQPPPDTEHAVQHAVIEVIGEVAEELGNTPAVCRKSYIHPAVLAAYADGSLPRSRPRGGLSAAESRVLHLLKSPASRSYSSHGQE